MTGEDIYDKWAKDHPADEIGQLFTAIDRAIAERTQACAAIAENYFDGGEIADEIRALNAPDAKVGNQAGGGLKTQ